MGRPFYGSDVPQKRSITAEALDFVPQLVRARVQGESEDEYRRYKQLAEGQQARAVANTRGMDTSGMAWDGTQFKDANWSPWYADPGVMGPAAVLISTGAGAAFGGPGAGLFSGLGWGAAGSAGPTAASTVTAPTVSGIIGPSAAAPFSIPAGSPFAAGATSAALPSTVGGLLPPGVVEGAGVEGLRDLFPGGIPNATSGGFNFAGMSATDIAKLGAQGISQYLNYRAANGATEAQLRAAKDALDFAKKAYEEQNAKEQARWDANEERRKPYREASLASLAELRRVLGL